MHNLTQFTAGNVAAELYMRKGYEILRIEPMVHDSPGFVDITGDVWVAVFADHTMRVQVSGLSGQLSEYPYRTSIDSIIMDLESALSL